MKLKMYQLTHRVSALNRNASGTTIKRLVGRFIFLDAMEYGMRKAMNLACGNEIIRDDESFGVEFECGQVSVRHEFIVEKYDIMAFEPRYEVTCAIKREGVARERVIAEFENEREARNYIEFKRGFYASASCKMKAISSAFTMDGFGFEASTNVETITVLCHEIK